MCTFFWSDTLIICLVYWANSVSPKKQIVASEILKNPNKTLAQAQLWLSWLEHCPWTKRSQVRFLLRAQIHPWLGCMWEGNQCFSHINVCLCLSQNQWNKKMSSGKDLKNPNKNEPHLMQSYYIWYFKIQIGKEIC